MSTPFGPLYAEAYDFIYGDKPYDEECALIDRLLQTTADQPPRAILDLGCGTGNHALRLAARGYEVLGVDRAPEMLRIAQEKARRDAPHIRWHCCDLRELDLPETVDAAIMMFAVLSYQIENEDVLRVLRRTRRHLKTGGVFLFDFWFGPAVLAQRPSERIRTGRSQGLQWRRTARGTVDLTQHRCDVALRLEILEGERVARVTEELHPMRFFFPRELELFLNLAGLRLIRLGAFPDFDRGPDETTWNVLGVARAQ